MAAGAVKILILVGFAVLAVAVVAVLSFPQKSGPLQDRPLSPRPSQSTPLRIAVFGTSLSLRAKWPDNLTTTLETCGIKAAQIARFAKAGANSSWAVTEVEAVVNYKPDVIIIEFGINDGDLFDGLWPWQSLRNHQAITTGLQAGAPEAAIILLTTNPVSGLARLQRPNLRRYNKLYSDLAQQSGIGLFDGYGRWLALPGWQAHIVDGVHPDPQAEADLLTQPLTKAIATGFGATC